MFYILFETKEKKFTDNFN